MQKKRKIIIEIFCFQEFFAHKLKSDAFPVCCTKSHKFPESDFDKNENFMKILLYL